MKRFTILILIGLALGSFPAAGEEAKGIRALYLPEGVPARPGDAAWGTAPEYTLNMEGQQILAPYAEDRTAEVMVRALHDGEQLALRLEWADTSVNREVGVSTFRDAVAIGFPTRLAEDLPSPFMGDEEQSVNIWQWTADFDANAQGLGAFAARYPYTEGVWFFPQDYMVSREVRGWRGTEPVIELIAHGFGTLERKDSQNVLGLAIHSDGHWRVVLRRRLVTGNPGDTLFRPGQTTYAIFAIWDGARSEVNGRKAVTMEWTELTLDPTFTVDR